MKIDINIAILAYIRSQYLNLSAKDYENLIYAIQNQMTEEEVKKHVEGYATEHNRKKFY